MSNHDSFRFPSLDAEQTQRLLSGIPALPLPSGAARRIRTSVLKEAAPKALARNRARRVLIPIAACLLAVAVFFTAFPKAALAVSSFLGKVFTPSRYMNDDPTQRTSVPSIEEAIANASPQEVGYTVTLMPDLPNAQELIDYRAANGYDAFSEETWGWLKDIQPEIAEVLYDGNQLIWNTNLYTSNEHVREFMEGFGVKSGSKLRVDALMGDVSYTIQGDPTGYPLNVSGHGITPIFDETALSGADHVVLYSDFGLPGNRPLPSGVLTITQNIRVCENDALDYGATVAVITHTFTFDTTQGNTASAQGQETLLPLSGDLYLSMDHKKIKTDGDFESWVIETKKVFLDGVTLRVSYEYLPTGISVLIKVAEKPIDWTDDMVSGFMRMTWRNLYDEYTSNGVAADLYVDGIFVSEAPTPDSWQADELRYILPVFPTDYANTQSVVLKLSYAHYVTLGGTDQIGGDIFTVPEDEWDYDAKTALSPLLEITVPIPKS